MTDVEDRLRHDLMIITERAQPGSIRPLRAPQARRRSRAVRWLAPVAAMVAVIGIIAGVSLAGQSAGNRPRQPRSPPGTPKYYVTLKACRTRERDGDRAEVGNRRGPGVGADRARSAGRAPYGRSTWITAAANDRVFAIGEPFGH